MIPVTSGDNSPDCRGNHRLVHQGQALVEPALAEQRAPLQIAGEGDEVRFREALADRGGAGGRVVRFAERVHVQVPLAGRQQEVARSAHSPSLAFHQPLGPAQPSAGAPGLAAREEAKPEPERGAGRGQSFSSLEERVIQALLGRQHVLVPRRQPRG